MVLPMMKRFLTFLSAAAFAALPALTARAGAHHVLVVVMDGLRPESALSGDMPALSRLAQDGVVFSNFHSAFPSGIGADTAVVSTGCFPAKTDILADA